MHKFHISLHQFEKALEQLQHVLAMKKTDVVRDSAIKRFEITLDLAWKATKAYLKEKKGEECNFPKDCIRKAFKAGLVRYDDDWIKLIDLRNNATHTYNEAFADELYKKLTGAEKLFSELLDNLRNL